ncbi:hypothetical protein HHK36_030022 [Tetracentron sinense]|uniref:Uncharacterized protein n=1 Tax=Tetracentron sinense TaxID=13715 RepID=A0A835D350_TETSI|nr:hypothetical protein HHK36_030022 [Tetracentron sinense]
MATLQKFKLFATQCAIAGSPSRNPTTSPVFQLRRRKTLRMLLSRSSSGRRYPRREELPDRQRIVRDLPEKNKGLLSHKLKDLFVSSPPLENNVKVMEKKIGDSCEGFPSALNRGGGWAAWRGGAGSPRPMTAKFRYRFVKRVFRPVLVSIPE